ncbi:hypothetical protein CXB51_014272 [Gossypium anomalum]|uniref:Reverse transcriptase zinc-binding domain-containing protein n=1 Tax=Gossypium anomalum TaxID=47600 RepID=A0A8J6D172_9ROSI|nr:hypothetical protein CXB51_014272 [Gossypium anomalum]
MVEDLIDSNTRSWKIELIESTFSTEVAQKILQIPLSSTTHDDLLAWRGEQTGEYTLRSGHKLLIHGNFTNSYNLNETRQCYKKMWMSDLPSKIIITAWRVALNYLPTLANLRIKSLLNEAVCPRCMEGLENMEHIFRDCVVTKEIWVSLNFPWPANISHMEFTDWFTWSVLNSEIDACRKFLCAIWAIWSARNKWIHESQKRSGIEVAWFILKYL